MRKKALVYAMVSFSFSWGAEKAQGPDPRINQGTLLPRAEVDATLQALPPGSGTEQMLRMVDVGRLNVGLAVMRREVKPQGAIEHDNLTEVYVILSGSGVLTTGRNLSNPKPIDPESKLYKELTGPSKSGVSVIDGHSERFGPGDAIVIPAGVGHWFSSLDSPVNYLVARIDPDKILLRK
jgi:mannose-6-phosphate isomerase-like protein (cupin superfamily)